MNARAATGLRLAIGVGALAYIVLRIDTERAWRTLREAETRWLLAALGAQCGAKTLWVYRWRTLLAAGGQRRGLGELFRLILLGLFFNNFLPSSVGGDVARGLALSKRGVARAAAGASVVADRFVGLLTLALLAVVGGALGALFWPRAGPWGASVLFALAVAAGITGITRPEVLERIAASRRLPFGELVAGKVRRLLAAIALLAGRGRGVAVAIGFSLGLSASSAIFHWSIARAVGIELPLVTYFVIVPAVMLFAALPVSLNGLGIRELGFVGFLGAQGVPAATAAVFALLAFLGPLLFAIGGGVVFLSGRHAFGTAPREGVS